jgi:hypothetical protein
MANLWQYFQIDENVDMSRLIANDEHKLAYNVEDSNHNHTN